MALPPGIVPKSVTVGIASFFDGSLAEGTATITAPVNVVHGPSNRPIFSSQMSHRFVDGETTFNLCPTDAPGLNRVDWTYSLRVVISGALVQPDPVYFTLPAAGPDSIDLDSLVTVPSSAGTPIQATVVTSVNGQTGDVTVSGGDSGTTELGYDLVLILGQSNAAGVNTGYDTRTDPADGRVFAYNYGGTYASKIAGALDPLWHQSGAEGVGPGLPFARWYAGRVGRPVLLVPAAYGGRALVPTTGQTWNSEVRGQLYDAALVHAQAALAAAGSGSKFVAVLWHQGESDAGATQAAYADALDKLIGRLRRDLGDLTLPFIVGGMVPEYVTATTSLAPVNAAHIATPSRVRYTAFAPGVTGANNGGADTTHYTPVGARALGRGMAAVLPTAHANSSAPAAPVPVVTPPDTTAPTVPTGLVAGTPTATTVPLTWTASTDSVGVTGYKVRRGGTLVGSPTTTSFTDSGLTASTLYSYTVSAVDAAGNESAQTAAVTATTAAATAPATDFGPTLIAATGAAGTPTYATGKFGNALTGGIRRSPAGSALSGVRTIEVWARTTATAVQVAIGTDSPDAFLGSNGGNLFASAPLGTISTPISINDGAWHHLAVSISATTGSKLFVDGVQVGAAAGTTSAYDFTPGIGIRGWPDSQYPWNGGVDEVRLSSVARYTTNFTPPTGPFTTDGSTLALWHLEA